MRRTKIICTIGPASSSEPVLSNMIEAGMDIARLNFSHGTQEDHHQKIRRIRDVAAGMNRTIGILQDLPGPKIRVGRLPETGIQLLHGRRFLLTGRPVEGSRDIVSVSYPGLPSEVKPGDRILLADGALELKVLSIEGEDIACEVVIGGRLTSHKGINIPSRSIQIPAFTPEDREHLAFGLEAGIDMVCVSFVRNADDLGPVKRMIAESGTPDIPVIAKIERHDALEHLDSILQVADGIMVARGDMGVEIPLEKVPGFQKQIIRRANAVGKPVITATHMLKSMIDACRPTRAEAADVANAVLDGSDAVMLSEETATGHYPVESVRFMDRIAAETEKEYPHDRYLMAGLPDWNETAAVANSACMLADHIQAAAIVAFTQSGTTARQISRFRPRQPILALSPDDRVLRFLTLSWNVQPCKSEEMKSTDQMFETAAGTVRKLNLAQPGDAIVITAGLPVHSRGQTNLIRVKHL